MNVDDDQEGNLININFNMQKEEKSLLNKKRLRYKVTQNLFNKYLIFLIQRKKKSKKDKELDGIKKKKVKYIPEYNVSPKVNIII